MSAIASIARGARTRAPRIVVPTLYGRLPTTSARPPAGRASEVQSHARASAVSTSTAGNAARTRSTSARSTSSASTRPARRVSSPVKAPRPGPISTARSVDVVGAEPALDAFARETPPVPVSFVDVRPFGSTAVYLAPVATPLLRDAHARAHASFDALARGPSSHFTRDAWVPHCTLAMDLTRETSHAAWTVSQEARLPLEGRLERAALVEFRPARVHAVRLLTGR